VDEVPWTWVAQTRPGGRIVTPWGRLGHIALTVSDNGRSATGWFQGLAQFMPARGTAVPNRTFAQVRGDRLPEQRRPVDHDLTPLRSDPHLLFALRVALPEVQISTAADDDGVSAWLHDNHASWASLSALGGGRVVADQGGPRLLADELEAAWHAWTSTGSPSLYDYGMSVTPTAQYVWANDPVTGPRWQTARLPLAG
jgi:hypothetical protein